ncbi:MAG: Gfo/Idh/MocA family protein [Candidatus Helarchaeota archaeon]
MKEIRVGFIGCGNIANIHALSLRAIIEDELFDLKIEAAYDIDKNRLENFCKRYNINKQYYDLGDFFEDNEINAIYVCTPTKYHKDYVLKCFEHKKNVFCEKPLATNLNDVKEIYNASKRVNVISQVGFVIRYTPIFDYMVEKFTNNKEFGRMMTIMFRDDQTFPIGGKYRSYWRSKKELTGGGTLIEHSIHDLDAIITLCGDIKSIYCKTRFYSKYDVEDLAILSFELENGALGTLTSCWHQIPKRDERLIEVFYENAWLKIEITPKIKIELKEAGKRTQKLKVDEIQREICQKKGLNSNYINFPFYYEDLEFIYSINDNKKSKTGFEAALKAHEVIDAAYKSAKTNEIIRL